MTGLSFRLRLYRLVALVLLHNPIAKLFLPPAGRPMVARQVSRTFEEASTRKRVWFHAASVGELQVLWPVILLYARERHYVELIITIFSVSAERALAKLLDEVNAVQGCLLWAGFSPVEGKWGAEIASLNPDVFVSTKYEAWPELWASLAQAGVPLVVANAQVRSSLKIGFVSCAALTSAPLNVTLLAPDDYEANKLSGAYRQAKILVSGDPRWDQMERRSKVRNERTQYLIRTFSEKPRPWGVIGSAWLSDLKFLGERLYDYPGTLWIVPHEVEGRHFEELLHWLRSVPVILERTASRYFHLSSAPEKPHARVILVDEVGVLANLYESADWAYVGGGFEAGVHSTLEPGFFGVPIAIGPERNEKFYEIRWLLERRQLSILNEHNKYDWLSRVTRGEFAKARDEWKNRSLESLGASRKLVTIIDAEGKLV